MRHSTDAVDDPDHRRRANHTPIANTAGQPVRSRPWGVSAVLAPRPSAEQVQADHHMGSRIAPARADLVEELDSGRLYLRAFMAGRYFWQPVPSAGDSIDDDGTWQAGDELHAAYWVNHGSYRRRAGRYYALTEARYGRAAA